MQNILKDIKAEDIVTLLLTLIKPQEVYNNCTFNEIAEPRNEAPLLQIDETQLYRDNKRSKSSDFIKISYEEMITLISNKIGIEKEWVESVIKELNKFNSIKNNDDIV